MGTTPAGLVTPTVGLRPTTQLIEAGHTLLPSVWVRGEPAAKFGEAAAPEPELEPQGLRSIAYGLLFCPPRPDQPLDEWKERKFAHSLRLVLPRMTAPAARSLAATVASWSGAVPTKANEPAVVCIRSAVSMLSLSKTGIPCSGPRGPRALRSASRAPAIASASGLISRIELTRGPFLSWSSSSMRSR